MVMPRRKTRQHGVRAAAALAAVAVALAAGACSSTTSATSSGATAPGPSSLARASGTTDITIWHGLGAANGVAFQHAIDGFNATNTDHIHVTATYQGVYADLLAKYTAAVRGGSAPTVVLAGDVATGYMADLHRSIPAATMAKANPDDLHLSDLSAAARSYYSLDGVQQGVPMNVSTPVLWVNRDVLARAGVDPASLTTLDSVVAAARTIKARTGLAGFSTQDDDWYIEQLTSTAGQDFCTPGNGRAGDHPSAITINTGLAKTNITKVTSLYTSGVAADGAADGSAAIAGFQAGKIGMIIMSSGILGALKSGTPFDYEALPYPTSGPSGKSGNVIGGSALWLSSTATKAQQVAGWKLETYLTSPAVQATFSQATGYIPINTKTAARADEESYLAANPSAGVFADQLARTPTVPATAGCASGAMQSIKTSDMSHIQAAWAGQTSIDSALDAAASDAKTAFAQYADQADQ